MKANRSIQDSLFFVLHISKIVNFAHDMSVQRNIGKLTGAGTPVTDPGFG